MIWRRIVIIWTWTVNVEYDTLAYASHCVRRKMINARWDLCCLWSWKTLGHKAKCTWPIYPQIYQTNIFPNIPNLYPQTYETNDIFQNVSNRYLPKYTRPISCKINYTDIFPDILNWYLPKCTRPISAQIYQTYIPKHMRLLSSQMYQTEYTRPTSSQVYQTDISWNIPDRYLPKDTNWVGLKMADRTEDWSDVSGS